MGDVEISIGLARLSYDEGERTSTLHVRDWQMAGPDRTLSVEKTKVHVGRIDPNTHARIRSSMADSASKRSLSPLVTTLARTESDLNEPVRIELGPVRLGRTVVANEVTAEGTNGEIVPDGTKALVLGEGSLGDLLALPPSKWDRLTVRRGGARFDATDVTMELQGANFAVRSPAGSIELPGRSLEFEDMELDIGPPDPVPPEHVEFAAKLSQMGLRGIRSAAANAGVNVANTTRAIRNAPFRLRFESITEDGEQAITEFETTGRLGDLAGALPSRGRGESDTSDLSKEAIVRAPDTTDLQEYAFEVTGDLEYPERGEDSGDATEEIIDLGDRVRVEGAVSTGDDVFFFSGRLIEVDVPPAVEIETRQRN
ncbi:hypothetical protein BRC82_01330 [Halobacteriales archaeon QS_1_67_19]|nr:MAG: hypothetical protein BRC82_01330 [Halobacteriales archaeon QS_1_67_19]